MELKGMGASPRAPEGAPACSCPSWGWDPAWIALSLPWGGTDPREVPGQTGALLLTPASRVFLQGRWASPG